MHGQGAEVCCIMHWCILSIFTSIPPIVHNLHTSFIAAYVLTNCLCSYDCTDVSGNVNITECSVQQLKFTLTEELNHNSEYLFLAACKDNGECVSENRN